MLLDVDRKETRCASLYRGKLMDLNIERISAKCIFGNIYRGTVVNILENIRSAFVDIGEESNGFLHMTPSERRTEEIDEIPSVIGREEKDKEREYSLQKNQKVLVQVVKEAMGSKGARLTQEITISGRYLVLCPHNDRKGISRKIEASCKRNQLRRFLNFLELPQGIGVICRTSSQMASLEELEDEIDELLEKWKTIDEEFTQEEFPKCLYEDAGLIKKAMREALHHHFSQLLINHLPTFQMCKQLFTKMAPSESSLSLQFYCEKTPLFEAYGVEEEIENLSSPKVWLPSGAYLFFEQTEAMHTIDVNSGKNQRDERELQETILQINLEAAREIARQVRLRNIGGLIICDFIDMSSIKNREKVWVELQKMMSPYPESFSVLKMSEFGLIEMTRQRNRESLMDAVFMDCPYCNKRGKVEAYETTFIRIEKSVKKAIFRKGELQLRAVVHPKIREYIAQREETALLEYVKSYQAELSFTTNSSLHLNEYEIRSLKNGRSLPVV